MFNLFVSIKPNIQKFTLLIEKVTFQEKQYNYEFFSTKFEFNRSLLNIKQYLWSERYLFSSYLKKTRWFKAGGGPRQGTFPSFQKVIRKLVKKIGQQKNR